MPLAEPSSGFPAVWNVPERSGTVGHYLQVDAPVNRSSAFVHEDAGAAVQIAGERVYRADGPEAHGVRDEGSLPPQDRNAGGARTSRRSATGGGWPDLDSRITLVREEVLADTMFGWNGHEDRDEAVRAERGGAKRSSPAEPDPEVLEEFGGLEAASAGPHRAREAGSSATQRAGGGGRGDSDRIERRAGEAQAGILGAREHVEEADAARWAGASAAAADGLVGRR